MELERAFSGSSWEREIGFCRAVRVGDLVFISGTAAVEEGGVHAPGEAYEQTVHCLGIIRKALEQLSVPMDNIVRTRIFVTDISRWEEYARAHREQFADNPPASAMVEIKGLMDPGMVVEIEADAVVSR